MNSKEFEREFWSLFSLGRKNEAFKLRSKFHFEQRSNDIDKKVNLFNASAQGRRVKKSMATDFRRDNRCIRMARINQR